MIALEKKYIEELEAIKEQIQNSDFLAQYLEEEDEEMYNQMKEEYEPKLEELHTSVAQNDPLQLVSLETHMCDDSLEGLFLPRILGYSVLRGALNDNVKYIRPQEHFKHILLVICNSSNFELLSQRIGQTIEVGFALSSDIWITNLIAEINNKQVKQFLQSFKLPKYRDERSRALAYKKYSNQFSKFNFLTASKPSSAAELTIEFQTIENFLMYRASLGSDSSESVYEFIAGILADESLGNSEHHLQILMTIGAYFELQEKEVSLLVERVNSYNAGEEEELFFSVLRTLQLSELGLSEEDYTRLYSRVEKANSKEFKEFLNVAAQIDQIGYINPEAIEMARTYYNSNKGLSDQNDCLRNMIFSKFRKFIGSLNPRAFHEYFEINKTFTVYMNIFANEKFNQGIKTVSMKYIRTLLRTYTEKRSKDYQDIKKFVSATFLDLGFLNEKEIKELFKTKRKKKATA